MLSFTSLVVAFASLVGLFNLFSRSLLPAHVVFHPLANEVNVLAVFVQKVVVIDELLGVRARALDTDNAARQNRVQV